MTVKELASYIAKKEAKLKQVSVGNIREIIGIVSDLLYEEAHLWNERSIYINLIDNGAKRAVLGKPKKKIKK